MVRFINFSFLRDSSTQFEFPLLLQINGFHAEDTSKKSTWPESLGIILNGKHLMIERKKALRASGRPGVAYIGKDKPVNITSLCKAGQNIVLFVSPSCVCVRTSFLFLSYHPPHLVCFAEFYVLARYHPT